MLKEMRRMRNEPVSERELAWVKADLPFGFVTGLQKAQNVAGRVAGIVLQGLPEDGLATFKSRVLALTVKDIQDAAKNFLYPDRMHWVIEGDAAAICPQLKELRLQEPQLGQVIVLDENEQPKAGCDDAT